RPRSWRRGSRSCRWTRSSPITGSSPWSSTRRAATRSARRSRYSANSWATRRAASDANRASADHEPTVDQHTEPPALRPPPLGVGTQLSLAVARVLLELAGRPVPEAPELAALCGRGLRSGIGLHGFDRGGLVVDGGRRSDDGIPPLLAHLDFPDDWAVLVILP